MRTFKAYSVERSLKAIRDRLWRAYYFSQVDHVRKIRDRKQRTDIGNYCFVNRTIRNWNQLTAVALQLFVVNLRFQKQNSENYYEWAKFQGIEVWRKSSKSAVKWSEVKCSDVGENGAVGKWNGFKSNERIVRCSWVKFKWEEMKCQRVLWS
jgi:hypothetical protein